MPKVLIYYVKQIMWLFLFWNTDVNENRSHVHVGKKGSRKLCKVWLEPSVSLADPGDLEYAQVKEILDLTTRYRSDLMDQWRLFKQGKKVRIIKVSR
jgi:hypothetical protein